ncbi:hypothetical protein [Streptomyces scabiei]|uniref:hypothetical protein n=1 Tax=Streptomyces scabiei TaxID=1930 RepID=UPI00131EC000|nr:hypothetical protein [Streptomyces scabiei]
MDVSAWDVMCALHRLRPDLDAAVYVERFNYGLSLGLAATLGSSATASRLCSSARTATQRALPNWSRPTCRGAPGAAVELLLNAYRADTVSEAEDQISPVTFARGPDKDLFLAQKFGGHRPLLDRRRDSRATVPGDLAERKAISRFSPSHHLMWHMGSLNASACPGTLYGVPGQAGSWGV